MTTSNMKVVEHEWTQVLDGEGFVTSTAQVTYAFNAVEPSDESGHKLPADSQMTTSVGDILWARSTQRASAIVTISVP